MGQYKKFGVTFNSGGGRLAGFLYLPAEQSSQAFPCVVLAHGFGGTMDRLFFHAETFAAAGLAALVFDYRNLGASEGQPRQFVDVDGQQADLRAAVAFARAHPQIDPDQVMLFGNSLGGAHVITVAAGDPRIAAVVAQIPFNGFPRKVEGRTIGYTLRFLAAMFWDALRGKLGLSPFYIPLVAHPGQVAITTSAEAQQHVKTMTTGGETLWRNSTAPRSLFRMMRYRPEEDAARLTMPLLVCIATDDIAPEELTRRLAERAPHGELKRYPGTHFSFYTDLKTQRTVLADQISFYRKALSARVR